MTPQPMFFGDGAGNEGRLTLSFTLRGEERAEDLQVEDSDADAVASRRVDTDPGGHGMVR